MPTQSRGHGTPPWRCTLSHTVHVDLGPRGYDIHVTTASLDGVGPLVRSRCRGTLAYLVTDQHVTAYAGLVADSLQAAGFQTEIAELPPGESQKSLKSAERLYDGL